MWKLIPSISVSWILLSCWITLSQGELEHVLQTCCQMGTRSFTNENKCQAPLPHLPRMREDFKDACRTTFGICCQKVHRDEMCERGKQYAREKSQCSSIASPEEIWKKDCCEACKLGLLAAEKKFPCSFSQFSLPNPWDKSFSECCHDRKNPLQEINQIEESGGRCGANNPCAHRCIDNGYSLQCSCLAGYKLAADQKNCDDIDECQTGVHNCDNRYYNCINKPGGFSCIEKNEQLYDLSTESSRCPAGYYFNPLTEYCDDIDECAERIDSCDPETHVCINGAGSYQCISSTSMNCPPGYTQQKERCVDIDECAIGLDNCNKELEVCLNSYGSYICQPKADRQCPAGYKWSTTLDRCEDVNECQENLHVCDLEKENCVNTPGEYDCEKKCQTGFRYDFFQETCVDVNECQNIHTCARPKQCINTIGSYICQIQLECSSGYKPDPNLGISCVDINECIENLYNCGLDKCVNTIGSFECIPRGDPCPKGFKFDLEAQRCRDFNECLESSDADPCLKSGLDCVNTIGSYYCRKRDIMKPKIQCRNGLKLNLTSQICEDINECEENTHNCDLETDKCENTMASFKCVSRGNRCELGYRYNTYTHQCEDIDECREGIHTCEASTQICINTLGRYECQTRTLTGPCDVGFKMDPVSGYCKDINECEEFNPCYRDQICENTLGSYQCVCLEGFIFDSNTKLCKDVNECQVGLHNCLASQRCDNTIGSFTCFRVTSCGTGYTFNAATGECEDNDECKLGQNNCGPGFVCRNTHGSFRCDRVRCPYGQKLQNDGSCMVVHCTLGYESDAFGNCADINECNTPNLCRPNQRCVNTVGSYKCEYLLTCSPGFEVNESGDQCIDTDECAKGEHECKGSQVCRNLVGRYTCECPQGYVLNAQRECEDVNECSRYRGQVCSHNSECQNTPGSYICICKPGFRQSDEDKRSCVDIDECAETKNLCEQSCINRWGTYHCTCRPGYALAADGKTCEDVNECTQWKGHRSLCMGECVNEPGSYVCTCPNGYKLAGDKMSCLDIDECREQNSCSGENEVCLNTKGGFKCNAIVCPENYTRDHEHRNRCKKTTKCLVDDSACLQMPQSFSYNFITFPSNIKIPQSGQLDLFTMRGPIFTFTSVQFTLDLVNATSGNDTAPVTRNYFYLKRTAHNEALIALVQTIQGPQDIELNLTLKMYHNGLFAGNAIAKLFIFVTEHKF